MMSQFLKAFEPDKLQEAWHVFLTEFPQGLWETVYVTVLATLFAIVIGMPLGILLVTGDENGIRPLPRLLMKALNVIINFLRSVPFIILMVMVIPLTRAITGTSIGSVASIVPLVVAAFPFVARLVESSLRELDPNIIEMAQSMGASTMQIVLRVMLPESVPSLVNNFTLAITTILGYTAMSGAMGGGGLGKIAINYGYNRYKYAVLYLAVIVLVIVVQVFQSVGSKLATRLDKRIKR
jgi:D-methionine transport system permease protein